MRVACPAHGCMDMCCVAYWRTFGNPGRWDARYPDAIANIYLAAWLAQKAYSEDQDSCTWCWSNPYDQKWEARMRNVLQNMGAAYSR
jgi:hypothetical protein